MRLLLGILAFVLVTAYQTQSKHFKEYSPSIKEKLDEVENSVDEEDEQEDVKEEDNDNLDENDPRQGTQSPEDTLEKETDETDEEKVSNEETSDKSRPSDSGQAQHHRRGHRKKHERKSTDTNNLHTSAKDSVGIEHTDKSTKKPEDDILSANLNSSDTVEDAPTRSPKTQTPLTKQHNDVEEDKNEPEETIVHMQCPDKDFIYVNHETSNNVKIKNCSSKNGIMHTTVKHGRSTVGTNALICKVDKVRMSNSKHAYIYHSKGTKYHIRKIDEEHGYSCPSDQSLQLLSSDSNDVVLTDDMLTKGLLVHRDSTHYKAQQMASSLAFKWEPIAIACLVVICIILTIIIVVTGNRKSSFEQQNKVNVANNEMAASKSGARKYSTTTKKTAENVMTI